MGTATTAPLLNRSAALVTIAPAQFTLWWSVALMSWAQSNTCLDMSLASSTFALASMCYARQEKV